MSTPPLIAVVDYGMSNLRSIVNAFEAIGTHPLVTRDHAALRSAAAIVLPGVGAFADGMANLRRFRLVDVLEEEVRQKGKPYLGICLGMQFLCRSSEEGGSEDGLGWIEGRVRRIAPASAGFKVPHMGWNDLAVRRRDGLFAGLDEEPAFYFVHGYHAVLEGPSAQAVSSTCWHGTDVTASLELRNIWGVQFHPEKSQGAGLRLLRNFADRANGAVHA